MTFNINKAMAATALAGLLSAPAFGSVTGVTNGDFEGDGLASGYAAPIADWSEEAGAASFTEFLEIRSADLGATGSATAAAGLEGDVAAIYQEIGAYEANEDVIVAMLTNLTVNRAGTSVDLVAELWSGAFGSGTDGALLSSFGTLLDSATVTSLSTDGATPTGNGVFNLTLNAGTLGGAGDALFLRLVNANPVSNDQLLVDDVSAQSGGIVPEPASLSLMGLGGLLVLRRRR